MEDRARRRSLGGEGTPHLQSRSEGETAPLVSGDGANPEEEEDNYLFKGHPRDPFSECRWRCITNRTRAVQTLTGWARLDIKAFLAKNLEVMETLLPSGMSYSLAVYSDDALVYYTPAKGERNPRWNHDGYINIIAPNSMIRFHVKRKVGSTVTGAGFVEICAGDIPFDEQIEGWFELRFEHNLQQTSTFRYKTHCKRRDDSVSPDGSVDTSRPAPKKEFANSDDLQADVERAATDSNMLTRKLRVNSSGFCCQRGVQPGDASDGEEMMNNAGELLLRLKLTRVGTATDAVFALALNPPKPEDFGMMAVQGLKDVQGLMDEVLEVKQALLEDCAICVVNYLKFIICWRRCWLSLLVLGFIGMVCINEWTHGPIALMSITLVLFCNSFERLRMEMVCSGHNAPLTDTGFRLVAALANTSEMNVFLRRTIEGKIGAGVSDKEKLKLVAARCFRDGKPLEHYEEFVNRLLNLDKKPKWLKGGKKMKPGALVLINERHRATVTSEMDKDGKRLKIKYDVPPPGQRKEREVDLSEDQVIFRQDVGFANNIPMDISGALEQQAKRMRAYIDLVECKVMPQLRLVSDIATWKKPWLSRAVAWSCFLLAIVLFLFSEWYKMCGDTEEKLSFLQKWIKGHLHFIKCGSATNWKNYEKALWWFHRTVALFLDHGFMVFVLIGSTILMMTEAQWLAPVKAVAVIIGRSCSGRCSGRKGPKKWKFFHVDDTSALVSNRSKPF